MFEGVTNVSRRCILQALSFVCFAPGYARDSSALVLAAKARHSIDYACPIHVRPVRGSRPFM